MFLPATRTPYLLGALRSCDVMNFAPGHIVDVLRVLLVEKPRVNSDSSCLAMPRHAPLELGFH